MAKQIAECVIELFREVLGSPKYSFQNTKRENPRKLLLNILLVLDGSILCNSCVIEYIKPSAPGTSYG